jgi:crossover junction endodeoxyribonuclease RuvC
LILLPSSFFLQNYILLSHSQKIILGIDPGTVVMGYSVIIINGNKLGMTTMDAVKLTGKDMFHRLQKIHQVMQDLIQRFKPQELAIEAPFYGKNVQSMLKLGRAQGIAIAVAMQAGIPVTEYSPRKVKQSITGNGNADKEQVWKMLQSILTLPSVEGHVFDASDALAVAVCHHFNSNPALASTGGKANNWEDFIRKNADRIRK